MNEDLFHVGVKALVINDEGKVLLLKIVNPQKSDWDIPGGRIQKNSSVQETLAREVKEETGLQVTGSNFLEMVLTDIRIPVAQSNTVGLALVFYACRVQDAQKVVLSEEHTDYQWVDLSEALELLSHLKLSKKSFKKIPF